MFGCVEVRDRHRAPGSAVTVVAPAPWQELAANAPSIYVDGVPWRRTGATSTGLVALCRGLGPRGTEDHRGHHDLPPARIPAFEHQLDVPLDTRRPVANRSRCSPRVVRTGVRSGPPCSGCKAGFQQLRANRPDSIEVARRRPERSSRCHQDQRGTGLSTPSRTASCRRGDHRRPGRLPAALPGRCG